MPIFTAHSTFHLSIINVTVIFEVKKATSPWLSVKSACIEARFLATPPTVSPCPCPLFPSNQELHSQPFPKFFPRIEREFQRPPTEQRTWGLCDQKSPSTLFSGWTLK